MGRLLNPLRDCLVGKLFFFGFPCSTSFHPSKRSSGLIFPRILNGTLNGFLVLGLLLAGRGYPLEAAILSPFSYTTGTETLFEELDCVFLLEGGILGFVTTNYKDIELGVKSRNWKIPFRLRLFDVGREEEKLRNTGDPLETLIVKPETIEVQRWIDEVRGDRKLEFSLSNLTSKEKGKRVTVILPSLFPFSQIPDFIFSFFPPPRFSPLEVEDSLRVEAYGVVDIFGKVHFPKKIREVMAPFYREPYRSQMKQSPILPKKERPGWLRDFLSIGTSFYSSSPDGYSDREGFQQGGGCSSVLQ